MAAELLDTVLLLALPASGKSEARAYMDSLTPEQCREEFHMGPTVQLDDYPYVHMMRCVDEALYELGAEGLFFWSPDRPFRDSIDWGTLIHLVNEDYAWLRSGTAPEPVDPGRWILERLDNARLRARGQALLSGLKPDVFDKVAAALRAEAAKLVAERKKQCKIDLEGKTIVIEFARGGPQGSRMPIEAPSGYQYSLSQLSDDILGRASILYIWVTPEESRRKNDARADPDDPGSILFHGVPSEVMYWEYGCDDIEYLLDKSPHENTVSFLARGKQYDLKFGRLDNREDKTTFIHKPPEQWTEEEKAPLHAELRKAMAQLVE